MIIWLVEDDRYKGEKIRDELERRFRKEVHIAEARSANSAIRMLSEGKPDLMVLDMSLPTFDIGPEESGGRPQGFGGVEVLREMERRDISIPVVVVTQYEVFESEEERISLAELRARLNLDYPGNFRELVYYEASTEKWRVDLIDALGEIYNEIEDLDSD